ncbi:hypothetical protein VPH35_113490 [Triticum aestivum]
MQGRGRGGVLLPPRASSLSERHPTSSESRHPPWMMTTTRASTATTTPRTWSNSATTTSTARLRPRSCSASTTTSSPDLWFIILTACHLCHRCPVSRTIGTAPPPSPLMM